jgi:hypothetical protein
LAKTLKIKGKDAAIVKDAGAVYSLSLDEAHIKIGGSDAVKFVPNINVSKWRDECWLNINHAESVVTTEKEALVADKVSIKIGDIEHKYYEDANGNLEYELIFNKEPAKKTVTLALDFPAGLEFFYQDTLERDWERGSRSQPLEVFLKNCERPENVVGSYAVYWSKKNDQYKTGKFCHIYRPELIDSNGTRRWAELQIDAKKKTLDILCDFSGLVFPVIVDPTIGYTTAGASNYGANDIGMGQYGTSDGAGGTLATFHCAIAAIGAPAEIKLGIYPTGNDGLPNGHTILEQVTVTASVSDVNEFAAAGTSAIAANTTYAIVFAQARSETKLHFDSAPGNGLWNTGVSYASAHPTTGASSWGADNNVFSLWVTYNSPPASSAFGQILVGGAWKTINTVSVCIGASWKNVTEIQIVNTNAWKALTT